MTDNENHHCLAMSVWSGLLTYRGKKLSFKVIVLKPSLPCIHFIWFVMNEKDINMVYRRIILL